MDAIAPAEAATPGQAAVPAVEEPARPRRFALSPVNRRRWRAFRAHRRGYWSLWVFLVLFGAALGSELIANDHPFLLSFEGRLYVPALVSYPETTFGGDFETEADYRDPYFTDLVRQHHGWMLWAPIRYSYGTSNMNAPTPFPSPPTWTLTDAQCHDAAVKVGGTGCRDIEWNWLGTDTSGRDVVARLLYGFRLSVLFGLVLTLLSSVVGVAAGAVQGFFGGWTDLILQRIIEIWTSVPSLYLLIILASVLTPNFWILLGILMLFSWTALVGVVRAEFLRARNFEYVRAARALGLPSRTIIVRHLLPNATVATLTFMPFILNGSISTLTSLDYLGLGLPPGSPSLGEMLSEARDNLQAPWLGLSAFLVTAVMLSLLIFIGEAVRDAFDPRKTFG